MSRLAGWEAGKLAGWKAGRLTSWEAGRLAGWQAGKLGSWEAGRGHPGRYYFLIYRHLPPVIMHFLSRHLL